MSSEPSVELLSWIQQRFAADRWSALDCFRGRLDGGMVREIAEADYSQDVEKHLEALRPLVRGERTSFSEIAC